MIEAAEAIKEAFLTDYVVLGVNAKKVADLSEGCRRGGHNAYFGRLRMWKDAK